MASNESFLHNLSSGFNGFVKFFTPSFLMRGSPPLLTTDDKSAPLDQNRSFENNGECRYICNKAVSKKLQNLPLDIDCSEAEYESERLFNGTFDPPLDSLERTITQSLDLNLIKTMISVFHNQKVNLSLVRVRDTEIVGRWLIIHHRNTIRTPFQIHKFMLNKVCFHVHNKVLSTVSIGMKNYRVIQDNVYQI